MSAPCPTAGVLAGRRHKQSVDFAGWKGGTLMTLYQLAGYLHLIGGVGLFVALGLAWAMIVRIRSAHSVEQARAWLSLVAFQRPVGLASLITVLIAGLYMAVTAWGRTRLDQRHRSFPAAHDGLWRLQRTQPGAARDHPEG